MLISWSDVLLICALSDGQVALEGNFRFVQDKSDFKSASEKKFVWEATFALENKICEKNASPYSEREVPSTFDICKDRSILVEVVDIVRHWSPAP